MGNTYGPGGNRWWVGMNVGETGSQSTIFGTPSISALNPWSPSGYESLPSGNASDDALFTAAAAHNKGSTNPSTISVENIEWYNIQGPFKTQALANAAIPAIQAANPAPGVLGQTAKDNAGNPVGAVASGLSAITSPNGFFSALGSSNLWVRAVKVIAGGVILIIGLLKLTGADQHIGGYAAKAVKAAPLL